ncbi:DUF6545 domain-containing protein [Streptomyces sp. NPDC048191]|uniref:DUF6545 domain-containing protein n=1 Tax=Streptomyces sp. NPDC048191 TaxID=3155484 RepID=UPI00340DAE9C
MSESSATTVYLVIAGLHLTIAIWKASALVRSPSFSLALQVATHGLGGIVYVVASPFGYRSLGTVSGQPWLPTLPIYLGILLCFGTQHLLTILWTPSRSDQPWRVRRQIAAWAVAYGISFAVMVVAFLTTDLGGSADPLKFNTDQVNHPQVQVFLSVFLTMLTCGTVHTWRRTRHARADDKAIMHSVRWYGRSMLVTSGYVVCSAPAAAAAALGHHQLDDVGVLGSAFGVVGSIMTCYGISGAALSKWLGERRDIAVLQPLWDLVVAGVDQELSLGSGHRRPDHRDPQASAGPGRSKPNRIFNVRWTLHRRVIEILDGIRQLERRAWISDLPAQAVAGLYSEAMKTDALRSELGLGKKGLSSHELEAAVTAAVLRDAVERLQAAGPDGTSPVASARPALFAPGKNTPAAQERTRLVRLARALRSPLVDSSLQVVRSAQEGEGVSWTRAAAR